MMRRWGVAKPSAILMLLVMLLVLGCADEATSAPAPEGRVNAVLSKGKKAGYADLCDVAPSESAPRAFAFPQLTGDAPETPKVLRWVNVWATWCKPCIEELPLLTRVIEAWRKQGHDVELTLLSVDADAQAAERFLAERPGIPSSLQLADPATATTWLSELGLASGSAIPVHLVVNARGQLLCARSGGIAEADLDRFARVMFP